MTRPLAETFVADAPCPDCHGQGDLFGYCCAYCDGTGRVPRGEVEGENDHEKVACDSLPGDLID
jgi:RecJ-like exonuclease